MRKPPSRRGRRSPWRRASTQPVATACAREMLGGCSGPGDGSERDYQDPHITHHAWPLTIAQVLRLSHCEKDTGPLRLTRGAHPGFGGASAQHVRWSVVRPGRRPAEALARALRDFGMSEPRGRNWHDVLRMREDLSELLATQTPPDSVNVPCLRPVRRDLHAG